MRPYAFLIKKIEAHPLMALVSANETGLACTLKLPTGQKMMIVASSGMDWDHVSVSLQSRTPKYQEMKAVKRFFFKPDEWVLEYHPPEADYVSLNDNVLHLWRPQKEAIPVPPSVMV